MTAPKADPRSTTHATKEGSDPAQRLPHERDESSDSQRDTPDPVIQKAHDDVASGAVDTGKGPASDKAYQKQKE